MRYQRKAQSLVPSLPGTFLSDREQQVLEFVAQGIHQVKKIAKRILVSVKTVETIVLVSLTNSGCGRAVSSFDMRSERGN